MKILRNYKIGILIFVLYINRYYRRREFSLIAKVSLTIHKSVRNNYTLLTALWNNLRVVFQGDKMHFGYLWMLEPYEVRQRFRFESFFSVVHFCLRAAINFESSCHIELSYSYNCSWKQRKETIPQRIYPLYSESVKRSGTVKIISKNNAL